MPAILELNARSRHAAENVARGPRGLHQAHPADQTVQEEERQGQNGKRQQQDPQEGQRDPQSNRAARRADPNDSQPRNHGNASSSRIASPAVISPRFNRSSTSAREGAGFVSTNSRLFEIRFSRDLMVG